MLFITTKNLDYLRNTQEIAKLRESAASVDVLGSSEKSYVHRLLHVYGKRHPNRGRISCGANPTKMVSYCFRDIVLSLP